MNWKFEPMKEIALSHWRFFSLPNGDNHVNGYSTERIGRTSSKISEIDYSRHSVLTSNGYLYILSGETGVNEASEAALKKWLSIMKIEISDITFVHIEFKTP